MELQLRPPNLPKSPLPKSQQAEQSEALVPSQLDDTPPQDGQPVPYAEFLAYKTETEIRIAKLEAYIFGTDP